MTTPICSVPPYNGGMNVGPLDYDEAVLKQARTAADAAVAEEFDRLTQAFETGEVAIIEKTFYSIFERIYLQGYRDAQA